MQIIILAGGEGKRMWPIATDKCLIPFLGKPLLYHNLKQLKENVETEQFVIVAAPQNKTRVEEIAQSLNLNFQIIVQNQPKGMADALLSAREYLAGEILVVNAEDVLEADVFKGIQGSEGEIRMVGLQVDKYFPGGYIKATGNRVQAIVEKPGEGNEPFDLVKLVVDYFKDGKKLAEYLEKAKSSKDDVYETALDQMIKDGLDIRFVKYNGVWIPLKYPWQILDITAYFLSRIEQQISPKAKVSDKAIIKGNVVIEEGVRVLEGAIIKGPVFIGKNCIVGNNSMVRESNLEEEVVIGFNSDITRSYIGANCWFHTNYIGDSVIEGDLGMGSGAVLANLRLDNQTIKAGEGKLETNRTKLGLVAGKGVRIGVNASIMPGVRVGANSLVGPGVVLKKDLAENKKITIKEQAYEVEKYDNPHTNYDQFKDKL